ncbi:MAG: aromatic ring-hydroxylating dioxygenase subunit alpha [Bauldia sp.]|nr:aromatic ring-hydroxylating dioxygenase subunit alpha [Bauldia sp.]
MNKDVVETASDYWYCIGSAGEISAVPLRNRLLGVDLTATRAADRAATVMAGDRRLPVRERYGMVWTTLGSPARDVVDIPEADEPDRRSVPCGAVTVNASGLRIVENFLDMAHFPFVHMDILGAEPNTEVQHYTTEIRRDVDEVWATNCAFFQPKAAMAARDGIMVQYMYRVATPFVTLLYKTSPNFANRWDVICLFVQPMAPDRCRAHPLLLILDDQSSEEALISFQQMILLQDRIILENQRPRLLPLDPRAEIPTRADASSVAYRRWLKEKGVTYGTVEGGL